MFIVLLKKVHFTHCIALVILIGATLVSGCAQTKITRNDNYINGLETGLHYDTVVETLGEPLIQKEISVHRFVAFYQTKPGDPAIASHSSSLCEPIVFEDFLVVGVGSGFYEKSVREEKERVRRVEIYEARRKRARMAEAARLKRAAERKKEIAALEKEVAPVPASNAALNLKLYRKLLTLDPGNTRYKKKVAYYENRLERQKKATQARAEKQAQEKLLRVWEKRRPERNQRLGKYTGNGTAEMAVYDMGNHSLYVWVKNVSKQIITTHPDYFTLLDNHRNKIPCVIEGRLHSVLEPGSLSHGEIAYHPDSIPNELIFQNNESGRISKVFQ
jgi:outer membrane protein assembly factor BamE (lipoprotein component of BamABCDE complex)